MDKNLPETLRRAAGYLEDITRKLHPEIKWTPWYIEAIREAADELERLQAKCVEIDADKKEETQ